MIESLMLTNNKTIIHEKKNAIYRFTIKRLSKFIDHGLKTASTVHD